MSHQSRRQFIRNTSALVLGSTLPLSLVELVFAQSQHNFSFACIADAHIQQIKGRYFVEAWDEQLKRAVAEVNALQPKPDFVVFAGDLAQFGTPAELLHGAEMLAALRPPLHAVIGEHDYYLDLGQQWQALFGAPDYSFDHKGVHFIVLNSIQTDTAWVQQAWESPAHRMWAMASGEHQRSAPFRLAEAQWQWLRHDLSTVHALTPLVVIAHAPLQLTVAGQNTRIQQLLSGFAHVNVLYGHEHHAQVQQLGHIHMHALPAVTGRFAVNPSHAMPHLSKLTVALSDNSIMRSHWQLLNMFNGKVVT